MNTPSLNTPSVVLGRLEDDKMSIHQSVNVEGSSPVEDIYGPSHLTWTIKKFSCLKEEKIRSRTFGSRYKWRVIAFPKGNNVNYLSLYIEVADSLNLPFGWNRYAQFRLAVVNQRKNSLTVRKGFTGTGHQFNHRENDWGFLYFMHLDYLCDHDMGFLVNDTIVIEADIIVHMIVEIWANDFKDAGFMGLQNQGRANDFNDTGFVGLENQGATCSLNSLLQTLYHIPYLRKAVYQIPTKDIPSQSVALALQNLFFKLQHSDTSVATEDLTKSLGWSRNDSLTQCDVHELNMKFCEQLENMMKGTVLEGTMRELFEGHYLQYVKCTNVNCKSETRECFADLQLDVKDCKDVYASFDKYTKAELLHGNNMYRSPDHGLQNAEKGVLFIDFPPILRLHLKRFDSDHSSNGVKINDRFEFPLQLDLDRGKYLSSKADRSVRNLYTLHSVFVHSGDIHSGHYYAYVRAGLANKWYKFNDDQVTEVDIERKLEELYGDKNNGCSSAYMLVYIREGDKDKIICDVDDNDIPQHLRVSLRNEKDKERYEAKDHLFPIIKVARDEDLREHIVKDIFFDLVDHDKVRSFNVERQKTFKEFKEDVANAFGLSVKFLRFWVWMERENRTYRPHRPLTHREEGQKVGQLRETLNNVSNAALDLFLESDNGPDLVPIPPPNYTEEELLLFFKFYDPQKQVLRYVGRLFVNRASTPITIQTELNRLAGSVPEQKNDFFKEKFSEPHTRIEVFCKEHSFSQMQNGDIIYFQACPKPDCKRPVRCENVSSFFKMVKECQNSVAFPVPQSHDLKTLNIEFHDGMNDKVLNFDVRLPTMSTVEAVINEIKKKLEVILDYNFKLSLEGDSGYSKEDFCYLLGLTEVCVLSTPLAWCPSICPFAHMHVFFQPGHVKLSRPDAEIKFYEVFDHRIYKVYANEELIDKINDRYWNLRAEEIPEGGFTYEHLFRIHHFSKQTSQCHLKLNNFGKPFLLVVKDGETLAQVKGRIQKKLQVEDEEFSKWKFAVLFLGHPKYLQDTDVLTSIFERRQISGGTQRYICLEHSVDDQPGSSSH